MMVLMTLATLVAVGSGSSIGITGAVLATTTGLVQGRRGGFLSTTGSFQLPWGGGRHAHGPGN